MGDVESVDATGAHAPPAVSASKVGTGRDEDGGGTTASALGECALPGPSVPGEACDSLRLASPDAKQCLPSLYQSPFESPEDETSLEDALPTPSASFSAVEGTLAEAGEAVRVPGDIQAWGGEEDEAVLPPPTHRFTPADVEYALSMLEPAQILSLPPQEESQSETESQLQARFDILQRLE